MTILILLQTAFNIILAMALWVLWSKFRKPAKDDPRLSRGLQLLQSKISVLEDLSDKTDQQVKQILNLLDRKCRELQSKVQLADDEVQRVEASIEKSLEVSKIFEDRIPHQEIIERQKTRSYVIAAQLAHQGISTEEISQRVDLPVSEIEMIAKVNKDKLMFAKDQLPSWASENIDAEQALELSAQELAQSGQMKVNQDDSYSAIVQPLVQPPKSLDRLGKEFRMACEEFEEEEQSLQIESAAEKVFQQLGEGASSTIKEVSQEAKKAASHVNQAVNQVVSKTVSQVKPAMNQVVSKASETIEQIKEDFSSTILDEPQFKTPSKGVLEIQNHEMIQAPLNEAEPEVSISAQAKMENSVEVIQPGQVKVSERNQVAASAIKRIEFPRID